MNEKKKDKMLTTRFDLQTMAEFSVAVELLGFRSINALVHQMVHGKIREAKAAVSAEEFARLVEAQKQETSERSAKKSKERLENIREIMPTGQKTIPILPGGAHIEKKKAS